jgi:hypothetical protein
LKIYLLLSLLFGISLLIGCTGSTVNTNTTTANNAVTNKSTNLNTSSPNQSSASVERQTFSKINFTGNWDSEEFNKEGNKYTQLSIRIMQNGENVTGTYGVADFVGKEAQIEDGNQTPFTGTIKDNVATIKFDTQATVAGYEQNVEYKEPVNGKPSTATLTFSGNKVQWKLTSGQSPFEIPKDIVLNKAK